MRRCFALTTLIHVIPALAVAFSSCVARADDDDEIGRPDLSAVPAWSRQAVWYQIFVERFRNGDPHNDPTPRDIAGAWPHVVPADWRPTPWGRQWYARDDWAEQAHLDLYTNIQARRYGGDLQGVIDQLDYLEQLGVTAIYLNPINDSPSLHKYDARNYRHVDRNFGPDPRGDEATMALEQPDDPATWQWTAADRLFLQLIREVHRRDMRIIIDYSWNHTGSQFWAWQDVLHRQRDSPYADWYDVQEFDDPATPANEFAYRGWAGVKTLPEIRKLDLRRESTPWGEVRRGDLPTAFKAHAAAVVLRWLDPHGDGDPAAGVDGFRLDVAELVPVDYWREFRRLVRSLKADALLVGEIWWQEYPDRLRDPRPWLAGDMFDAVMHYHWYRPTRNFVIGTPPKLHAAEYRDHLLALHDDLRGDVASALMNLVGSHDSPRVATSLANRNKYKYRASARNNADYFSGKPTAEVQARQKLLLVQQFTWTGAPHIYYGDEVGMWGADDPDCRKPMVWADLQYESETVHPHGVRDPPDAVGVDDELLEFYRRLIRLRRSRVELFSAGRINFLLADDAASVLAYERTWKDQRAVVLLNASDAPRTVSVAAPAGEYHDALRDDRESYRSDGSITVRLRPREALVLM